MKISTKWALLRGGILLAAGMIAILSISATVRNNERAADCRERGGQMIKLSEPGGMVCAKVEVLS